VSGQAEHLHPGGEFDGELNVPCVTCSRCTAALRANDDEAIVEANRVCCRDDGVEDEVAIQEEIDGQVRPAIAAFHRAVLDSMPTTSAAIGKYLS
jgi:hypothetical protein